MSMTGISSLIGYTRLQVAHLSAVPFLTSVTGVLQFGHARISSSSGSTGICGIYDTSALLWNNSTYEVGRVRRRAQPFRSGRRVTAAGVESRRRVRAVS